MDLEGGQEYLIQENDTINVFVWEHPELSRKYIVDPDGGLDFNLVGYLQVAGRHAGEIAEILREKYKKYFNEPVVNVTLVNFQGARISLIGEMVNPGIYPIAAGYRISDCLPLAAGPKTTANLGRLMILREVDSGTGVVHLIVDFDDVLKNGEIDKDLLVEDGDVIYVPEKRLDVQTYRWFIVGVSGTLSLMFFLLRNIF